jgi:hypothetical protein
MKSARNRRKKSKLVKKFKAFLIYSFISIVVLGFFLNTFMSNILEYSFALANTGGIVDIKTDEKYSLVLVSSNQLNEIKKISLINYDKTSRKMTVFDLNSGLEIQDGLKVYKLGELLQNNNPDNLKDINKILSNTLGTNLAFTYISSSDDIHLIEKLVLGDGNLFDLYHAREIENISLRDLYFIYSFAGSVDSKDKREVTINSFINLDRELRDIFLDSELGSAGLTITVINTTQVNGLGKRYTRLINNLGGRVVDTTSSNESVAESFIIYKEKSFATNYLATSLGIKKSLSMQEVGLKYPEIIKSDLVIVLGIDKEEK